MEGKRKQAAWLWHGHYGSATQIEKLLSARTEDEWESFWSEYVAKHGMDLRRIAEWEAEGADIIRQYEVAGIKLVMLGDAEYPRSLQLARVHMPVLSVAGKVAFLQRRMVAVVGSRESSDSGLYLARIVANVLISRGYVIASGGALGTDAAAHRECMRNQRPTVVVTATGVDQVYPKENADIFEYAWKYGAVVSQYPRGTKPQRTLFPSRNTLIAGLCDATVVAYCRNGSGALYTAQASQKMERPVFVAACQGFEPLHEGGLSLVKSGAARLLSDCGDLDCLGRVAVGEGTNEGGAVLLEERVTMPGFLFPQAPAKEPENSTKAKSSQQLQHAGNLRDGIQPPADQTWKRIYDMIGSEYIGRDEIARRVGGMTMSELSGALLGMELEGFVVSLHGRYRRPDL